MTEQPNPMYDPRCNHDLPIPGPGCNRDMWTCRYPECTYPEAAPRRLRTQAERDADGTTLRAAGFRVVHVPPTPEKPEVHTCDLPQSPSAVYARGLDLPKMGTVAECVECGQQWVCDWHSHMEIWSPLPRRRWWHRYTRRNP